MPVINVPVAPDDLYWIYPANREDLEGFFEHPHQWVADNAKATLAEHFVVSMRAFDGNQQKGFLIQGIDRTGLITLRTFPGVPFTFPDLNPLHMTMDLMLVPNPLGEDLPMRVYTHLELDKDPKYLSKYLVTAAGKTEVFLKGYSYDFENGRDLVKKRITPLQGLKLPFAPEDIKVVFRPATRFYDVDTGGPQSIQITAREQIEVLYQSHGPSVSPGDQPPTNPPPPPPACNSKTGIAQLFDNVLVVDVETIAVKAWPVESGVADSIGGE